MYFIRNPKNAMADISVEVHRQFFWEFNYPKLVRKIQLYHGFVDSER